MSPKLRRKITPWLFLAPALITFTWFKFVPMFEGLIMSFYTGKDLSQPPHWAGFQNFIRVFHDAQLGLAVVHTIIFVLVTATVAALLAFFLAMLLEGPARHLHIIRTAIFLPAITSVAILAEMWRILFNPSEMGLVNIFLSWFHILPQGFMSDPKQALCTIMLLQIWAAVPYNMVIFVAGLAGINRELYDASSVDGANWFRRLWHVTLPGMIPAISVVLMLSLIRGFRVFAMVYTTTDGGPAESTGVIMTHIYKLGFEQFDYGYASAVSFLLFAFTVLMTVIQLKVKDRIARY